MEPNADQPKAPEAKPGLKPDAKPDAKDDLKSLPMPELQAKLGRRRMASVKPRRRNG